MKKIIFLLLFVINTSAIFAQYHVVSGGAITTCTGTLDIGTTTSGSVYTMTICSGDLANTSHMKITFTNTAADPGQFCVYDGPSTASPLISCNTALWGSGQGVVATAANTSGCLTIKYTASAQAPTITGNISCFFQCQGSQANLVSTNPAYVVEAGVNYVNLCHGQQLTLNASGTYPNNTYPQSDATSTFTWDFGDGTTPQPTGQSVTHTYATDQGYSVNVKITDAMGCASTNDIGLRVRLSRKPSFAGTYLGPNPICQGTTVNLHGVTIPNPWDNEPPTMISGTTYLPDGDGNSYETCLNFNVFTPGQSITNISQLLSICMNIEHSYLGDLTMYIRCPASPAHPSGVTVQLEDQGGSGEYLGNPIDNTTPNTPGTGLTYCFKPTATNGTLEENANGTGTLPAGNYESYQSLNGLVGCPLNGQWCFIVTDNLMQDDGYLFWWQLNLDPSVFPNLWGYENAYPTNTWTATGLPAAGGTVMTNDNAGAATGTYMPNSPTPTQQPFTFSVVDNFGCSYDTTINVTVLEQGNTACCIMPTPNIQTPDQNVCGLSIPLNAGNLSTSGNSGTWSATGPGSITFLSGGNTSTTPLANVSAPGTYTFTWTEINNGSSACTATDAVTITFLEAPIVDAGIDGVICGTIYELHATGGIPSGATASWSCVSPGVNFSPANTPNTTVTVPSITGDRSNYTFVWTVNNGQCAATDEIKVAFYKVPVPDAGLDRTVCGISTSLNCITSVNDPNAYWNSLDENGNTYGNIADVHNPNSVYTVGTFTGGNKEVKLIWQESNLYCTGKDSVNITFALPPNSYAGSDISMCGTNTTLSGNSDGWSNGTWTGPTGVGFTDLHDPSTSLSTVAGSIYGDTCRAKIAFVWTLDNMGCTSSDTVLANMYQKSIASAGNDTTWCGLAVRLNGRPSINCYVGEWTVVPGTTGVTIPTNQIGVPKANITVAGEGVYTLVWTEKNQYNVSCKSTDTVKITVWKYPNINAGNDTTFCGNNGFLHATSGGYSSAWVPVSSASYVDASSPTTNVTWGGAPNTNVSFTYQESNHTCTSQDTVKVKFALKPVSTVFNEIMPDTNKQCGLTYIEGLQAPDPPANLDHYWTCPLTADEVYASGNTSPLTQVTVPSYGVHYFYWVLDNDGCADTSEAVAVNFIKVPTSDAGGGLDNADTLCGHIFDLQAIPSMGTGTWASSTGDGNVVFTDSSQASTTVNINYDDGRVVEILWTEDNNGCYDSDTLHLTVAPIPSANWSWQMPKCVGYSASIIPALNTVDTLPTFNWSFGLESQIDSINLDTIGVPHSGPWYVSWPNSTDPYHIVTLSTVNSWGCPSIIQTDTIYEPPTLGVTFAVVEDTCNAGKGQLVATGYGGTGINYAYSWQTPVTGLPSVATQTGLLAGTYTIQVLDENQCKELLSVSIPMVGMVTAMFDTLSLLDEGIAPDSVEFINESINAPTCMWYFDDNTTFLDTLSYYGKHVLHTYLDSGYYTIKLVAISELGCVDTFVWGQKHVKPGSMLEVANIFTPNGDGHNDIFKVNSRTLSNFKGLILDRWGKTMYEWTNEAEGWNGKVDGSGGEASPGVYFYIITGRGEDGRQYEFKGAFHLIREK